MLSRQTVQRLDQMHLSDVEDQDGGHNSKQIYAMPFFVAHMNPRCASIKLGPPTLRNMVPQCFIQAMVIAHLHYSFRVLSVSAVTPLPVVQNEVADVVFDHQPKWACFTPLQVSLHQLPVTAHITVQPLMPALIELNSIIRSMVFLVPYVCPLNSQHCHVFKKSCEAQFSLDENCLKLSSSPNCLKLPTPPMGDGGPYNSNAAKQLN